MKDRYDVVVVGGGINGAGTAQAAAAAGHSVLVLEQSGLAAGTSSRSSKLIHGGLRYLETARFGLVAESLRERALLLRNAPHLVELRWFHLPVYGWTRRRPWQIRVGLSLYALLGRLRRDCRFQTVPRAAWGDLDGLTTDGLRAVFRYRDAQTDDAALTRAVMGSARALGAHLAMPARFEAATLGADGCRVEVDLDGEPRAVDATVLVNAAGPWVSAVLAKVRPAPAARPVDLVQGAHVELPGEVRRGIYYVESPRDRRPVFVMPWQGRTLVGTTERPFEGDPALVRAADEEKAYLLEVLHRYFPGAGGEIVNAWAGLRVLPHAGGGFSGRTREAILDVDRRRRPRLLTIYGGKLTTYRATAESVLRRVAGALPTRDAVADTRTLRLPDPATA